MTAMFEDIHAIINNRLEEHRVPGSDVDEVTYVDDTICFTTDTQVMNKCIQEVEEGFIYGLELNANKCELVTTHPTADIHFKESTKVPRVRQQPI